MTYIQRIGLTAVFGALLGALVIGSLLVSSEREAAVSYIVQGRDLAGVRAAVEAVGGEITHELGIIKAVGTELTERQVEALREMPNVRRVYANSGVRTSVVDSTSTAAEDGLPLCADLAGSPTVLFDGRKVIWPIVNAGASDAYIESAELRWPVANGELDKLKRDGANFDAFSSPVPGTSYGTIQPGDSDGRINDGDVGELFMEFSNDALADHKEYWIEVRFASGCRLVYAPREDLALGTAAEADSLECTSVAGAPTLKLGGDTLEWEITNSTPEDIYIESVSALWPSGNGNLIELKRDGNHLYRAPTPAPAVYVNDFSPWWEGNDSDARIDHDSHKKLVLKFQNDISADPTAYEMRVFFRNGCHVNYPPPAGALYVGDSDKKARRSYLPALVGASDLHWHGIDGQGVGVAGVAWRLLLLGLLPELVRGVEVWGREGMETAMNNFNR